MCIRDSFGMQLLRGRMAECNDKAVATKAECVGSFVDGGESVERWWGNDDIGNFDNIGAATLTLFCLLYTSPSPRDGLLSRMPSSA